MLTVGPQGQFPRCCKRRQTPSPLATPFTRSNTMWFLSWGFNKDSVYVPTLPMSLKELCDRITHALQTITADMLHRVWDEFDYRLDVSYDPECTHWRIMIHEWGIWTIAASGVVRCARVRWEINYMLTFETAPFFCVHPVYILFISRAFVDNVGVLWNSFC